MRVVHQRVQKHSSVRTKKDLKSGNLLNLEPEGMQPIIQPIARNTAQGRHLIDARAECSLPEIVVEIVREKVRRGTSVQAFGLLRYLVESETLARQDSLEPPREICGRCCSRRRRTVEFSCSLFPARNAG